jgi:hypothetical protein
MALTVFALAIFFWYGLEAMRRRLHEPGTSDHADGEEESMASISRETTIEEKIQHALMEPGSSFPAPRRSSDFSLSGCSSADSRVCPALRNICTSPVSRWSQ